MGLATVYLRGHNSTVAGSSFINNTDGFAAASLGSDALVSDCLFSGNIAGTDNIGGQTYATDIYHLTAYGTIKLHNNVFIPSTSGDSTPSILNEYGKTEYV